MFWCGCVRRVKDAGITCVPPVVTAGPRRRALEGVKEVEDGPGQHHDVVDVEVGDDDLGRHSDPCGTEGLRCSQVSHNWLFRLQSVDLSPWNKGHIFLQAVRPLSLVYWPSAVSRKKRGMPQKKKKTKYGMKKTPANRITVVLLIPKGIVFKRVHHST